VEAVEDGLESPFMLELIDVVDAVGAGDG